MLTLCVLKNKVCMKRLGLDERKVEELVAEVAGLKAENAAKDARISELEKQHENDQSVIRECNYYLSKIDVNRVVECINSNAKVNKELMQCVIDRMKEAGIAEMAEYLLRELNKKDAFVADIAKKLNYLKLSLTKKSEKYVPKDDNGLAEGQTIDSENPGVKHRKHENAKARGNNGAKHDPHDELPCTDDVIHAYPEGYDAGTPDRYELIESRLDCRYVYVNGYIRKQYYEVMQVKDRESGAIMRGRIADSPLRGSRYGGSLLADILTSKFGWHQSVTCIASRYRSIGFNANEGTLNGLINKTAKSLFFRNLDTVLLIAIKECDYLIGDESYTMSKTESAKIDREFIRICWLWEILAVKERLVRYSCRDGSRKDEVGYELFSGIDHQVVLQTDGKSCYRNIGTDNVNYPNITRVSCLQHQSRYLKDIHDPRAKKILGMIRNLYHLDHLREKQANEDEAAGMPWSKEDHLKWRRTELLPEYLRIVEEIRRIIAAAPEPDAVHSDTESVPEKPAGTEQPLPKELRSAFTYILNEEEATKLMFTCNELCHLNTNDAERVNRSCGYLRRINEAFGSIEAAESQTIFISLIESARLHGLNLHEYFCFLFGQMAKARDSVVKDKYSRDYQLYRKMLPDVYAEEHKPRDVKYGPPESTGKPLNKDAKRCGYKKRQLLQ